MTLDLIWYLVIQ